MQVGTSVGRPGRLAGAAARWSGWARLRWFLAVLGPGVIGLVANNDAGGMLSYLETGARHGLAWTLPALIILGGLAVFVQWVALRVAQGTGRPYTQVLIAGVGALPARVEALVLYGLNTLILTTEFVGMDLALALAGVPRPVAVALSFGLVAALTSAGVVARIERLLLWVALGSLAFVPALLSAHHAPHALARAFTQPSGDMRFLLLALAGNAIAPWMIYWQQNATWSGPARTRRAQIWDLGIGAVAFVAMSATVIVLGGIVPTAAGAVTAPLAWLSREGGRLTGALFGVGLFDAGLLAACTISLASLWTLREGLGATAVRRGAAPNRGPWFLVHLATLGVAAAAVLAPHLAPGALALWANALTGVWMPVSLALLALVARNRRLMGAEALAWPGQLGLWTLAAGFAFISGLGLARGL